MKTFITYWIIGCILVGLSHGQFKTKCPNDEIRDVDLAAAVSVWPVAIFMMFTYHTDKKYECKVK